MNCSKVWKHGEKMVYLWLHLLNGHEFEQTPEAVKDREVLQSLRSQRVRHD